MAQIFERSSVLLFPVFAIRLVEEANLQPVFFRVAFLQGEQLRQFCGRFNHQLFHFPVGYGITPAFQVILSVCPREGLQ